MKSLMRIAFRAGFYTARASFYTANEDHIQPDLEFDSWFATMGGEELIAILKQINKD